MVQDIITDIDVEIHGQLRESLPRYVFTNIGSLSVRKNYRLSNENFIYYAKRFPSGFSAVFITQ